jgi:4-amino-4-deoxy-L-arabinose transferase-like glycosyltransferase
MRVLTGHGFTFATDWWPATKASEPTAHWSFLYTLYLAGIYGLVGHHPLAARLIQAVVVGLLMPWLVYRIGWRLFSPAVGLVAALITTFYAYFVYYAVVLMTESFYITAILWALDCGLRTCPERSRRIADCGLEATEDRSEQNEEGWPEASGVRPSPFVLWLELGLALGMAALLRQVILLFVPFLFAWLWWNNRQGAREQGSKGAGWRSAVDRRRSSVVGRSSFVVGSLITLAVLAALILPWTVRNYLAFGQFVLLNTNSGYAFFWANHPIHGTHFIDLLPTDGPSYQDLIPPELRSLDEATLDRALLERGLGFVREDPVRFLVLSLSRIPDYFQFWPSSRSALVSNLARVLSFGLFLPFMAWGLVLARHRWRACLLLYLFVAVYSLAHILSWTGPRYRLPVDAVLIVFAGLAVATLVERAIARWPRLVRLAGRWGRGIGAGEKRL